MNTSIARHTRLCDSCNAEILYPDNKDNVTIDMSYPSEKGTDTSPYNSDNRKTSHYCDTACASAHLQKIIKTRAKAAKISKASEFDGKGNVVLDITFGKNK